MHWIWNKDETAKYNLDEFKHGITIHQELKNDKFYVKGWYSADEGDVLGIYDTNLAARLFLSRITDIKN